MSVPIWNTPAGLISTLQEGDPVNIQLDFSNPIAGPITATILAGSLPNGLVMDSAGLITGILNDVPVPSNYVFTVRLTNNDGIIDRAFEIAIQDIAPDWADISNLGAFAFYSLVEYQFFVTDPGGQTQTFLKIAGELPVGLNLNAAGHLIGILNPVLADTTYNFTLRAFLDGTKFEDKDFEITVLTSGNRAPIWNTPAGLLAEVTGGVPYSFQFSAGDPDGDPINYSGLGIPPGFTLSSSGFLTGAIPDAIPAVYSFTVIASDASSNSSRIFKLNANEVIEQPIDWITPAGSLGNIGEGHKSLFGVKAESISRWVRYEISGGSLPPGLILDPNTGDIWGLAEEQGGETTYDFTVRAYNQTEESFRDFSITVEDTLDSGSMLVQVGLYGDDRLLWQDLFTDRNITIDSWFRQGDNQFGLVEQPRILLVNNLINSSPDEIFNTLEDVRRTNLTFGKVEVAKAVVDNTFVYEVLYRKVYDDSQGSLEEVTFPQTSIVVKPGALQHLRDRLLTGIGTDHDEILPLWMTSEQIIGDSDSILGWIPAIVFAHVQPGSGQAIADKINSAGEQQKKLYLRRARVDRIMVEPLADTDFEPVFILFDNEY